MKEGPGWHTFQNKNVTGNFISKLPQSIHGWKNRFFFPVTGELVSTIPWNRRRSFLNYEVSADHDFIKKYKDMLIAYSFGMIVREGCWDESTLAVAGFYSTYEVHLYELN